jgi:CRP-like cAMP-binding protein
MSRADRLFGLLASQPAVSLNIAKYIAEQRDAAMSMMEDIAYLNVADRIVRLFERLAGEHGRRAGGGVRIDVRLTHADIAALVGSSRETVSLEISRLVKAGRLGVEGKTYTLPAEPVRTTSRGS